MKAKNKIEEPQAQSGYAAQKTEAPAPYAAEITPRADRILKVFSKLQYAWIDSKGGVFEASTPAHLRKGSVLYKNPYYKQ